MTNLDKQLEGLIKERNAFEAENVALKAQVNVLREALDGAQEHQWCGLSYSGRDNTHPKWVATKSALASTPEQCLNSVKASAVQGFADTLDGNSGIKVYKSRIKKDGRDYAIKLRNNNG